MNEIPIPEGSVRQWLHQDSLTARTAEYPPNEKWSWRRFSGWRQDTQEWTDKETGEAYPPTFNWYACFTGRRLNVVPLAEYFYVRISVAGEEGKPLDVKAARFAMERGAAEFDSYADCECTVEKKCKKHGVRGQCFVTHSPKK